MKLQFLITALVFLVSSALFGQTHDPTTLEVMGHGHLTFQPDIGRINIIVKVQKDQFSEAVGELYKKTELIYHQLNEIGLDKDDIKTNDFRVNVNRVFEDGQSIERGYVGTQTVVAEFANEKEQIAKIIQSFSESTTDVQFNFSFAVSSKKKQEIKNQLIELAVIDANAVAQSIAKASNQELGRMVEIKYGTFDDNPRAESRFNRPVIVGNSAAVNAASGFDVAEVSFSDSVVIKWTVK